jgi:hypothetical protein
MTSWVRSLCVLATLALMFPARAATAQGITSAAVAGRLADDAGGLVASAAVSLTGAATGLRYSTRSADDGRYNFENVQVGGPYTLEVRALGFQSARVTDIHLRLGQRLVQDLTLKRAAVEVAGITVTAEANPLLSQSRTGAQSFVSESALRHLPTLNRTLTDFVQTVPQVVATGVPGTTIGGQNNRFNVIQIDGGVNNDVFAIPSSGTPGGQANARPISVEALREYQVLIAPFDIRQGSFAGGLINAVTRSGANDFHGSAFVYTQGQDFVGKDAAGNKIADFVNTQYGVTLGGPIIRDRLHFFGAVDWRHYNAPFGGLTIGTDTTGGKDSVGIGIRRATAESVTSILVNQYGFDPGTFQAPPLGNPDRDIFGKLTAQLGTNSQLELSHNFVDATSDVLARSAGFGSNPNRDGYQLSNSGYHFGSKTNTSRAKWSAQLSSRFSNELLLGYQRIRDKRNLGNRRPLILVNPDRPGSFLWIAAGGEKFSQANSLDQDIYEVTDNLTFPLRSHLITVGTHNEFFHFVNVFFPASLGVWNFSSPDSLRNGLPYRYEVAVPGALKPEGPIVDFNVQQYGAYVQDQWSPRRGLAITAGLRLDIPVLDKPTFNAALETSVLRVNTADFPSANPLVSPRLGFNYDVLGDQSTMLRGGVGIFSGRPPYVWMSNAFSGTGLEQALLTCTTAATVPTFTVDPDNQPGVCAGGGAATPPIPSIVYFDSDFKFPQSLKAALGADRRLPWGIVGTFDFVYAKSVNQFYISDVNLQGIVASAAGEAGRAMYGTINPATGSATALRRTSSFRDVLRHSNKGNDRSFSLTGQLQKRFSNGVEFNVAYTYSHTEDLMTLRSSIASSNFANSALDGTIADRRLRTSLFDIPHKITASGTVDLKYGFAASVIYIGQSGGPFSYTVTGDANADGVSGNDLVYVPRNAADITLQNPAQWPTLDAYITSEPCLTGHRGAILARNTCRNSWLNFLNLRVSNGIRTVRGQSLELSVDLFNVLNVVSSSWGLVRRTADFEEQPLLSLVGYDTVNNRGVYALNLPVRNRTQVDDSRWRLQFGAKYSF